MQLAVTAGKVNQKGNRSPFATARKLALLANWERVMEHRLQILKN
jgi:hypothetical protein